MFRLFVLHNESVNIWSHLLGSAFIIFLIVYTTIYITKSKDINTITDLKKEIQQMTNPILEDLPNLFNIT